jgi:predicted membrane-bound spermidine synthase
LTAVAVAGVLLLPAFSRLIVHWRSWGAAMALIAGASICLGLVFPLIVQATAPAVRGAGQATARIYAANIAGATAGSILTGFYLMDVVGMARLSTGLGVAGIAQAMLITVLSVWGRAGREQRRAAVGRAAVLAALAALMVLGERPLFAGTLERLFVRPAGASPHFVRTIENRSGIIAVTESGELYGGGVYDGVYNTDLRQRLRNQIHRAFAVTLFHPSPRRILMIGLGSGSWARVLADDPLVEHITIVELNPGYVELLADHPSVADLPHHRKVRIEIDDGRRWLLRHRQEQFDVIVANTVYHWRANASSLLSVEFLDLIRQHLAPGGVYYFNSTSEARVQKTGAVTFPYGWRFAHLMAVSDRPIVPDLDRWRELLFDATRDRGSPLDPTRPEDVAFAHNLIGEMRRELEAREAILARTVDLDSITDDNMGTEWRVPGRYRLF